jgi:O-antigen ligase
MAFLFLQVVALLDFDYKFIKYFFYCIFICFSVLILDGFYQYFTGVNILGLKSSVRVSSFFGDEKILGSYLARLWPIFFGLSIYIIKKKSNLFYVVIFIFILSEALIFTSGDRSAFFFINLSAIFIMLFSHNLFKLRLVTLISSLILVMIISFINPTAKERVFNQTINQIIGTEERPKGEKGLFIFTKTHTHHYITAYRMYLDNKIIGVGVKNFRKLCKNKKYEVSKLSCASHPHNTYIQILSETGIIGFLFLMMALIYFCINVVKHLILKMNGRHLFH